MASICIQKTGIGAARTAAVRVVIGKTRQDAKPSIANINQMTLLLHWGLNQAGHTIRRTSNTQMSIGVSKGNDVFVSQEWWSGMIKPFDCFTGKGKHELTSNGDSWLSSRSSERQISWHAISRAVYEQSGLLL